MYRPAGLFHKQRNMAIEHDGRTSWGGHITRSSYSASKPLHTILLASEIRQHPVYWEHHIWDKPNHSGYMPLQPGIAIHSLLSFILVDLAIGHVCCKAARESEGPIHESPHGRIKQRIWTPCYANHFGICEPNSWLIATVLVLVSWNRYRGRLVQLMTWST